MSTTNQPHRLEEDIDDLDDSTYVDWFSYKWHEADIPWSDAELHEVLSIEPCGENDIVEVTDIFWNDPEALAEDARLARNLAAVEAYEPYDRDKRFSPLIEHDWNNQKIELAPHFDD